MISCFWPLLTQFILAEVARIQRCPCVVFTRVQSEFSSLGAQCQRVLQTDELLSFALPFDMLTRITSDSLDWVSVDGWETPQGACVY